MMPLKEMIMASSEKTFPVYHFTDTLRLPWIVESGALRPSFNRILGTDYLWATTNPAGDRTASALHRAGPRQEAYRAGQSKLVRFTLSSAAYTSWSEIKRTTAWTREQIAEIEELEKSARGDFGEKGVNKWRCRVEPLPIASALIVEAKSYRGRWAPIHATPEHCFETDDPLTKGFILDGIVYCATRFEHDDSVGYWKPERIELDSMWELPG
jgi:hypothetical protein